MSRLAVFEALVAEVPDLERKGKTTPYTSMNGNMFAFIGKNDELAFRLSKADRSAFLQEYPASVVTQHGRVMKDYVDVPEAVLTDDNALRDLWDAAVANARALKPKPTKKKKKKTTA